MSVAEQVRVGIAAAGRAAGLHRLVRRRHRGDGVILLYHDPAPDVLARHFAWLAQRFTFVPLDVLVDALVERRWGDLPPNPLVVTLDDGHAGNRALLPVFQEFGVRPTIYLVTRVVGTARRFWFTACDDPQPLKRLRIPDRDAALAATGWRRDRAYDTPDALSRDDLEAMAPHVDFESHTLYHPVLTMCDDHEAREEIVTARAEVEALTGRPCRHFSYPNGDHLDREVALARQAGYRSARTVDLGYVTPASDPFRLPILGIDDDAPIVKLSAATSGLDRWVRWVKNRALDGRSPAIRPEAS